VARILLDTHTLIWWHLDPLRLSRSHAAALAKAEQSSEPVAISAITLREIAALVARGRIESTVPVDQLLAEIESHPLMEVLPLTAQTAGERGLIFHAITPIKSSSPPRAVMA
jgi:PIN domain nuclease of toxin-antitoxin system